MLINLNFDTSPQIHKCKTHPHSDCQYTCKDCCCQYDYDDENDYDGDNDGYPAYSHQPYSHHVGICHNDESWEYDTVTFPPFPYTMINIMMREIGCVVRQNKGNPSDMPQTPPDNPHTPLRTANNGSTPMMTNWKTLPTH